MIIAQMASFAIDAQTLMAIPLSEEGVDSSAYKTVVAKLKDIKRANPLIKYIYTMAKTDQEGVWQFIADPDPVMGKKKGAQTHSYPGDRYAVARFPQMSKAFEGPSADIKLEIDEWGVTLSGYAPIFDKANRAVAMVGVDIEARDIYTLQRTVHIRALLVLLLGILVSLLLGMFASKRIVRPIKELVEGTRRIAKGELNYQVHIKSDDEIALLAASFNRMAKALNDSQKKLMSYFYDVVQSLVRILEARDPYIKGHSESVAVYAEKIALRMGFPPEKAKLLREIALLHDIGKLGIQESVLNKKESLTEKEWEIIKQHPLIGEEMLRPVLITEEMLTIVRGHHERYDGAGYPDRLRGDSINIFAAILSVADAYDAMVSDRAYRSALSKTEALAQLKNNKHSQFNPAVVDTFVAMIEEGLI